MSIRIETCVFIEFPIDEHGKYVINIQELKFWNKTSLKRLVNDIVSDWQISFDEKCMLLQEIEKQLMHDYEIYKSMYDNFGVKKYQGIAKRCIEIAEICRVNGRDKYENNINKSGKIS